MSGSFPLFFGSRRRGCAPVAPSPALAGESGVRVGFGGAGRWATSDPDAAACLAEDAVDERDRSREVEILGPAEAGARWEVERSRVGPVRAALDSFSFSIRRSRARSAGVGCAGTPGRAACGGGTPGAFLGGGGAARLTHRQRAKGHGKDVQVAQTGLAPRSRCSTCRTFSRPRRPPCPTARPAPWSHPGRRRQCRQRPGDSPPAPAARCPSRTRAAATPWADP